jgi:hypothetical protein
VTLAEVRRDLRHDLLLPSREERIVNEDFFFPSRRVTNIREKDRILTRWDSKDVDHVRHPA